MSENYGAPATQLVPTEPGSGGDVALPTLVITPSPVRRLGNWLAGLGTRPSIFSVCALVMSMSFIAVGNLVFYKAPAKDLSDLEVFLPYFFSPAVVMGFYLFLYLFFAKSQKFQRGAVSARFALSFVCWWLAFSLLSARWYSHHSHFSLELGLVCAWANLGLMIAYALVYGIYAVNQTHDLRPSGARRICWGRLTIILLTLFAVFDFGDDIWEVLKVDLYSVSGSMMAFCVACFACFICHWLFSAAVDPVEDSGVPKG